MQQHFLEARQIDEACSICHSPLYEITARLDRSDLKIKFKDCMNCDQVVPKRTAKFERGA